MQRYLVAEATMASRLHKRGRDKPIEPEETIETLSSAEWIWNPKLRPSSPILLLDNSDTRVSTRLVWPSVLDWDHS